MCSQDRRSPVSGAFVKLLDDTSESVREYLVAHIAARAPSCWTKIERDHAMEAKETNATVSSVKLRGDIGRW